MSRLHYLWALFPIAQLALMAWALLTLDGCLLRRSAGLMGATAGAPAPARAAPALELAGTWWTPRPAGSGGWLFLRVDGRALWWQDGHLWAGRWFRSGPDTALLAVRPLGGDRPPWDLPSRWGTWPVRLGRAEPGTREYGLYPPPPGRVPPDIHAEAWGACEPRPGRGLGAPSWRPPLARPGSLDGTCPQLLPAARTAPRRRGDVPTGSHPRRSTARES